MSVEFFGVNHRIDLPGGVNGTLVGANRTSLCMMAWIYMKNTVASQNTIFGMSNGLATGSSRAKIGVNADFGPLGLRVRGNGRCLDADGNQDRYGTPGKILLLTWHHVAVNFDYTNKLLDIYVDGVFDVSQAVAGWGAPPTSNTRSQSFSIGSQHNGGSEYFNGYIEDARVYGRKLTADEIQTIYACMGTDGIRDGLCHRYVFEEGAHGVLIPATSEIIKDTGRADVDQKNGTLAGSGGNPRWIRSSQTYSRMVS